MYTIVDDTGRVLYCRTDVSSVEGEISINKIPSGNLVEDAPIFYNFETEEFYQ